ncbi:hypothetical protein OKW30_001381 [Paraburkholderia sp. Clong3]|uniref:HNH endonuclease signature motif containing protein n=1 Tax=Paraburkholderia sp. Clong3 TaxID=2991061 RepID=UPI003D24E353
MDQDQQLLVRMIELYRSGKSCREIAVATSKSVGTVWRWLRSSEINFRPRGSHSRDKSWTDARRAHHPAKPARNPSAPRGYEILVQRSLGNKGLTEQGYVVVNLGRGKRQYEHILIAEKAIGRRLRRGEVVHHINTIRHDNRPQNLLVCTHRYHLQLHARMRRHPFWSQVEAANRKTA